jgi:hypothetical protein
MRLAVDRQGEADWPLTGKEKPLTESTAKQRPEATN